MDEIEFRRAFGNLNVLVDSMTDSNARNALKVVAHILHGLDERITEMQMQEDDDDE